MSSPRHYFTLAEYFAVENVRDARYEFWDGEIVCMSGGSPEHGILGSRMHYRLAAHVELRQGDCIAFTGDQAIETPQLPPYRYPDASVVCDEPIYRDHRGTSALVNPRVIVEVLSPRTEAMDLNDKRDAYQAIASLREYVVVAQDAPKVMIWRRVSEDRWELETLEGLDQTLRMPSIDFELPLTDLFRSVRFPPALRIVPPQPVSSTDDESLNTNY